MLIVGIYIGLVLALGRFLALLDRDDSKTFAEVATPEEIHLGQSGFSLLGKTKFLLHYVIPRTYEFWNLSAGTTRFADRLRFATAIGIPLQLGLFVYLIIQQF